MTSRRTVRLVAAAVLAAAAGLVLPAPTASAATCDSSTGVSVVVDFSKLGGGIASTCNASGGGDSAAANFEVDHDLTRVQQFPGAVCRVDNTPADAQCRNMPPEDAYWGLFWSDGSGGWTYSSQGVDSLDIPDGGSVAFAWQDGGDKDLPGTPPPQHAEEEPSSSPSPSQQPSGGGGGGGGNGGGTTGGDGSTTQPSSTPPAPTASASASASPSGKPGKPGKQDKPGKPKKKDKPKRDKGEKDESASASPEASPSDDPSDAVPTADAPTPDDDGLPAWVAPAGIAALFGVAGVIALLRRRAA